jgi:hypothetical protein
MFSRQRGLSDEHARHSQPDAEQQPALPQRAGILGLQRLLGNQQVMRMLARPAGIQRLTVQNTQWDAVTRARGSSAGASGGVMLVNDDTPEGIVLKGMKSANAARKGKDNNPNKTIMSLQLLETVGEVEAGQSRVIEGGEKDAALDKLRNLPQQSKLGSFDNRFQFLEGSQRILVMTQFKGSTLHDLASGPSTRIEEQNESAQDSADRLKRYQKLIDAFQNKTFLRGLGKMLAVDAFLDNRDRVRETGLNFGNVMVSDDLVIQAIDSDSRLDEIDKGALTTGSMKGVEAIAHGNVTETVDNLRQRIEFAITTNDHRLFKQHIDQHGIDLFAGFDIVKAGVKDARERIIKSQAFKAIIGSDAFTSEDFDPRVLEQRRKYLKYRKHNKADKALGKVKGNSSIQ